MLVLRRHRGLVVGVQPADLRMLRRDLAHGQLDQPIDLVLVDFRHNLRLGPRKPGLGKLLAHQIRRFDLPRARARVHFVEAHAAAHPVFAQQPRLPLAHGAYALAALLLPLSYPVGPQPLMSLPRFEAVLYPLFLWLGWWLARRGVLWRVAVLGTFAVFLAACSALFSTWHWVA